MKVLREKNSKKIQVEAFHLIKIFVVYPRRAEEVTKSLEANAFKVQAKTQE